MPGELAMDWDSYAAGDGDGQAGHAPHAQVRPVQQHGAAATQSVQCLPVSRM
jgi:hypothetical protein